MKGALRYVLLMLSCGRYAKVSLIIKKLGGYFVYASTGKINE